MDKKNTIASNTSVSMNAITIDDLRKTIDEFKELSKQIDPIVKIEAGVSMIAFFKRVAKMQREKQAVCDHDIRDAMLPFFSGVAVDEFKKPFNYINSHGMAIKYRSGKVRMLKLSDDETEIILFKTTEEMQKEEEERRRKDWWRSWTGV